MKQLSLLLLIPLLLSSAERYAVRITHPKKGAPFTRLFTLSDQQLNQIKSEGERLSGITLPDLTHYMVIKSDLPIKNGLKRPKPTPPPTDQTVTPNLIPYQTYLEPFHEGINGFNYRYGWEISGGDGSGVTIVDLEYDWQLDHEDLNLKDQGILYNSEGVNLTGTPLIDLTNPDYNAKQHGVAVLGIMGADHNEYGLNGAVPAAELRVISSFTKEYPKGDPHFSVVDAILRAASVLQAGDILLIEAQTTRYGGFGSDFIPVEYDLPEFLAIRYATAKGIVVVEAGGNGDQNLDQSSLYGDHPQLSREGWRYNEYEAGDRCCYEKGRNGNCLLYGSCDSGAIIVGAGDHLVRTPFSSYGSRFDLQGWGGYQVATLGFGDLFEGSDEVGSDPKRYYTKRFSGTSAASPMIAAVAAQLQGAYQAIYNEVLHPIELRSILADPQHSHLQLGDQTQYIGPQPDVKKLFDHCFQPCGERYCHYYQECREMECVVADSFCITDQECSTKEVCYLHHCIDICSDLSCQEHMSCHVKNGKATCLCDEGYQLKEGVCYKQPLFKPTAAPHPSCGFNDGIAQNIWLILLFFMVLRRLVAQKVKQ